MSNQHEPANDAPESSAVPFGSSAFVVAEAAKSRYKPGFDSPACVVPPYGTEVPIVRDDGAWVLVKFCGKEAWSPRGNLSARLEPMRAAAGGEPKPAPAVRYTFNGPRSSPVQDWAPPIEFGPRGGRFVRTAKGFKRYL